jgi:2,4-dienoyl-CoA reductase-like NADH-dependent reductase (Old Yellow Enzyme family)/thioredoxin reductase
MLKYPKLFTPFKIGNTVFRNRIFTSPTGYMDFLPDGTTPTEDFIAYYERKAMGGAATVCVGECHINPAVSRAGSLGVDILNDATMRAMGNLAERVRRLGAVPSMELQHAGLAAAARLGPSDVPVDGTAKPCYPMTEEQIQETIQMFADAAWRARYYGFGMVTVHGGHGWLLGQFFSPATNRRSDRWGGSAENRARLAVAVCDAIHEKCGGDFPIEIRISVTEFEDGYDVPEGVEYAKQLDGHADIIHCSVGLHGHTKRGYSLRWAPSMYEPDGAFVKYAAEVKKHITKSYVSTVGAHSDPNLMEEILASGKADIINMARALGCDPDLPNKARAGRDGDIRRCIRCYGCSDALFPRFRIFCALNPETGRENEFARFAPPPIRQRVLVAGGGAGGMEAAISCARLGHTVLLCEKTSRLGGIITCEEDVPFKKHLSEYLELQKRTLLQLGVEIRLNCAVTPAFIDELSPDAVIASIGAKPFVPPVEGADGRNVLVVEDALRNPGLVGQRVVIVGAGPSGSELAVYLSMLGRDVALVELGPKMTGPGVQTLVTRLELQDRGIIPRLNTKAVKITADGLHCASPEGAVFLPAETVVLATGVVPLTDEAFALGTVSPVFHMIGDCVGGQSIKNATEAAHTIASMIGRQ